MSHSIAMVETGGWGGIGQYTHFLCQALVEQGAPVRLITHAKHYAFDDLPKDYPVEKLFVGDGMGADWGRLLDSLARHGDGLLHTQSLIAPRRDWAMVHWQRLRQRLPPLLHTVHNVLPHELRRGDTAAYRMFYRATDALIVHSQASRHHLVELMGNRWVERHPVETIHAGHFGGVADQASVDRPHALQTLDLPDHRYITCFGAIRPYKGTDWLLEAMAQIADWPSDVKVLVIGKVLAGMSEEDLTGLAERLGIADRVIFRFGYLPEEQIPHVFAVSDLIALPYRMIDQSAVLLAALAAGKPILATPVGTFNEIVDQRIGFMASEVSSKGVAEALRQALANRATWSTMGQAAKVMADTEFGWEQAAMRTLDFYRRIAVMPF